MIARRFLLAICSIFLITQPVLSSVQWDSLRSEHFEVFFPSSYETKAREVLHQLELHRAYGNKLTGKSPRRFPILIEDIGDVSNGFAQPFLQKVHLYQAAPDSSGYMTQYANWMRHLSFHEYIHYSQFTNTSGVSTMLSDNMSTVFSPNLYSPGWLFEGLAVYGESTLSTDEGRLNDGYYAAALACKAAGDTLPSYAEMTASPFGYPLGSWYVYGSGFIKYLAETYGADSFGRLFNAYGSYFWTPLTGGIIPDLGLDKAAREVYGKSLAELYGQWITNLKLQSSGWSSDGTAITHSGWNKKYLTAYKNNLYYYEQLCYPTAPFSSGDDRAIVELDPATGRHRTLVALQSAITAPFSIRNNILYYAVADVRPGYGNYSQQGYGYFSRIVALDLGTGSKRNILDGDISAFTVLPDSSLLYFSQTDNPGVLALWLYRKGERALLGTTDWYVSEMIPYGDDLIAVARKNNQTWDIVRFDTSSLTMTTLIETPFSETQISLADNLLHFTSNSGGKYGIYTCDMHDSSIRKLTDGGYAISGVPVDDSLFFVGLTTHGNEIFRHEHSKPMPAPEYDNRESVPVEQAQAPESAHTPAGYHKANQYAYLLRPYSVIFPDLLAGEDALGKNSYLLSYSPFGSLDMTLTTKEFSPLEISVSNLDRDTRRETYLSAAYPLIRSLTTGLYELAVAFTTNLQDDYVPELSGTITLPRQTLLFSAKSNIRNQGFALDAAHQLRFPEGSIVTKFGGFKDIDHIVAFHGYTPELYEEISGITAGAQLTRRLLPVRHGLLSPFVFFGDLYGSIFVDYLYSSGQSFSAAGGELSIETQLGYLIKIVPGFGVSFSENEQRIYWSLGINY